MSKQDIIRMAREAKLNIGPAGMGQTVWGGDADLERFAALVAAVERERAASKVEELGMIGYGTLAIAACIRTGDQE
jgi:hypothetical protein